MRRYVIAKSEERALKQSQIVENVTDVERRLILVCGTERSFS